MKVFAFDIGQEFSLKSGGIRSVFPSFGNLFSTIIFNVYGLVGIVLVLLLIFGGINFIIGAGSQNTAQIQQGQKALTMAVVGFSVIVLSYLIVQIIEVLTGAQIFNPGF